MVRWLASEQISRTESQSVLIPAASSNGVVVFGSLVQRRKESVELRLWIRDDLQGESTASLNSSEPGRSVSATS
eukprot:scaffold4105_cov63-Phaeocystis_antarctica.AAC.3